MTFCIFSLSLGSFIMTLNQNLYSVVTKLYIVSCIHLWFLSYLLCLDQQSANYGPYVKSWPWPVFVQSSKRCKTKRMCSRNLLLQSEKPKIFTCPFIKSLLTPLFLWLGWTLTHHLLHKRDYKLSPSGNFLYKSFLYPRLC